MNNFYLILFGLFMLLLSCDQEKEVNRSPNVIMILADDQGWGDLSIHGNPYLSTPHIDAIAKNGASFDHFFVQPVCSPTRAELLTGRYHPRAGVRSTSAGGERIDLDERLVSEMFLEAGYRTACFGKWHSGGQHPYHPNSRGFENYYGFTSGHWGHYFNPPLDHNGELVTGKGYLPDDLTNQAINYIKESEDPFFVYLAYNTPHSPMQVPDKWWSKFEDVSIAEAPADSNAQNHARAALAMVENIDWNVGRVIEMLKETGQFDNTIVLYMTDNGPNGIRWNGGMKGRKGSTDEGGVRSPLFVQWPQKITPGLLIEHISAAIDITPTLLDLCQISPTKTALLDGMSLAPLLLQHPVAWPERTLIQHWRGRTSLRTAGYRLDNEDQLFDMTKDPSQLNDVSEENAALVSSLFRVKDEWAGNVLSQLPERDTRPFTVGHPDFKIDHLPARDGIAHGSITRSNKYPNDSYFTNWTNTEDSITWDVEVLSAGQYEFSIYYTCPDTLTGSTIDLSIGNQRLPFKIAEGHDPPSIGANEDRVPRIESYVKNFQEITVGQLFLEKGLFTLTFSALNIPNDWVMEINRVTVRKL